MKLFVALAAMVFAEGGWAFWSCNAPSILIFRNNAGVPLSFAVRIRDQMIGADTLKSGDKIIYFFRALRPGDFAIECQDDPAREHPILHVGYVAATQTAIAYRHRITLGGCDRVASYEGGLLGGLLQ